MMARLFFFKSTSKFGAVLGMWFVEEYLPGLKYRVSPGHNEKPLHIDHKSDHNKDIYEHY